MFFRKSLPKFLMFGQLTFAKLSEGLPKFREHFLGIDENAVLRKAPAQAILSMTNYMDGTAQIIC